MTAFAAEADEPWRCDRSARVAFAYNYTILLYELSAGRVSVNR